MKSIKNDNLIKYLKQNKNKTFQEMVPNEIDALIFSILSYNIYPKRFINGSSKLKNCISEVIELNKHGEGLSRKMGVSILKELMFSKRYEDIILSNYQKESGSDYQFGVIMITIPNHSIYINFEGTDSTVAGWFEDFQISYIYPIKSSVLATLYLNRILKDANLEVTITGHSKGGYLAVIGSIRTNYQEKIGKVYSFDSPGIYREMLSSLSYRKIRERILHILPEQSFIGTLFYHEKEKVIKSNDKGIMQHSPINWQIEGNHFIEGRRNKLSKKFSISFNHWLNKTTVHERKEITESIVRILRENGIQNIAEINLNNIPKILSIMESTINLSKETKKMMVSAFMILVGEVTLTFLKR